MTAIAVYDELRKADKHSKWFLILEVTIKLQIILEPSEEGGYTVTVPALPGCISEGDSLDEAVANIQEAIELYLEPNSIPDNKNLIIRELVVWVKFLALLIQKLLPLSNEMVGDLFVKKAVIFV